MPHKAVTMVRAQADGLRSLTRPITLAVAGDSAAGKTTLVRGLVDALGPERVTAVCVDDYHRYDRTERAGLPFTPLHPACNYIEIMEQHLQLIATGQPILKPVYDHATGTLTRPELVTPREFVIVEGLLPLHSRLTRACFDVSVYVDPPEDIRWKWKLHRDCSKRGYKPAQVLADLKRREPESAMFIRPQRAFADMVVQFAPVDGVEPASPLSATLLLRPTVPHPDLTPLLSDDTRKAMHLKLVRDMDGKPVDALHVHGHAPADLIRRIEEAICGRLEISTDVAGRLGVIDNGRRSDALATTQLILLYHMLIAERGAGLAQSAVASAEALAR